MSHSRLTRRKLLQAGGIAGFGMLGVGSSALPGRAASDLLVMDWTGYEIPELHQPYIKKHGASPDISIFSDLEEAWQKIAGGFKPDVMHADHWQIPSRAAKGMFEPWDVSRIPSYPDLIPDLVNLPTLRVGEQQMAMPVDWGINSICYRTDLITPPDDWNALWDKSMTGRIAMTAQMNDAVSAAAQALGIANPFVEDKNVQSAIETKLAEQRPLLRFYWSDPTQLSQAMATGEVAIAFAWPSVYKELKAKGLPVKYMRPKQGVLGWAQGMLLMANRDGNTDKAYDFLNAWLDPQTGRWLIENYGYGHSNSKSFVGVDPAVLADLMLEDPGKTLATSFFIRNMPDDVKQTYVAMFERIKAGG